MEYVHKSYKLNLQYNNVKLHQVPYSIIYQKRFVTEPESIVIVAMCHRVEPESLAFGNYKIIPSVSYLLNPVA